MCEKSRAYLEDAAGLRENSAFVRGQVHNTIGPIKQEKHYI